MEFLVWVDGWQQECCGEPFWVGGVIDWRVNTPDQRWFTEILGSERARSVDYAEEHHDGPTVRTLEAKVQSIDAVYCIYGPPEPSTRLVRPIPGRTTTRAILVSTEATTPRGQADLAGYLVFVTEL